MNTSVRTSRRSVHGFSLIELIVGIAISLIGVLVMFRMTSLWDLHSRTTTSGGDAQVTGTLAIYSLERDIKPAGMGFGQAAPPAMGCNVLANDLIGPRAFNFPLQPVSITVGAGGAPDQITVLYGDSSFYVSQDALQGSTATSKTLRRRNGFRPGDLAVVAGNPGAGFGSANCALVEITGAANPDNKTVDHGIANYTSVYTGALKAVRYNTVAGVGAGFTSGMMYSLGPAPQLPVWQITNGRVLSRTELIFNTPQLDVAENVINLKAQYGVDSDGNGRITNNAPNEWTTVAPPDFTQVLAIRVAVLVRSRQFERSADGNAAAPTGITQILPSWAGGNFVMTNLDGTADSFAGSPNNPDPNNWRFYRYRVYEKVIPLRNMIWDFAMSAHLASTVVSAQKRQAQRGIVMWVALVVLIVMSLAGLAMLRQMGAGVSIAGNIAFKENATSSADAGTEVGRQWLVAQTTATLNNDLPASGYYATWGASVDPTTFDWSNAGSVTVALETGNGNNVRYIVHRLCQAAGPADAPFPLQRCSDVQDDTGGSRGGVGYGTAPPSEVIRPYYRVTVQVTGPRGTVSYTQVVLS